MMVTDFSKLDLQRLPSPCFVVDRVALERNLKILNRIQQQSGAKILHALKAFSLWHLAPLTRQYLTGTCASGLHEARLGKECYGGEVHVFSAAYTEQELLELLEFAHHIVFNSPTQLLRFQSHCRDALRRRSDLYFGLRINPMHSEGQVAIYDPCALGSRLGVTPDQLYKYLQMPEFLSAFELISGLHFHSLCEQNFQPLQRTLIAIEKQFGDLLPQMNWLNFGGGHHITCPDYQRQELVECIRHFSSKYQLQVYLEPGEAIAIGCGILSTQVLDITHNQLPQAILNTSAVCHMPDTIEMPYRPDILGAGEAGEKPYTYRLGGQTCLAGDVISDYSFDFPLEVGQHLLLEDMAHYTMVKTNTFNGINLPSLAVWNSHTDELELIRQFNYRDFKDRLS